LISGRSRSEHFSTCGVLINGELILNIKSKLLVINSFYSFQTPKDFLITAAFQSADITPGSMASKFQKYLQKAAADQTPSRDRTPGEIWGFNPEEILEEISFPLDQYELSLRRNKPSRMVYYSFL
jgi:hypothetical protein